LKAVPGPTRRAYEFLRTIDFNQIALRADEQPYPVCRQLIIRGLVARVDQITEQLATAAARRHELTAIASNIARVRDRVEQHAGRANTRLEELTARSREHLAWLRYFDHEDHFREYVDAVVRAETAFESVEASHRWPQPIAVLFRPTHSVFRVRAETNRTRVLLPTPMVTLSGVQFDDLEVALFGRRSRKHNRLLHALLLSERYQQLRRELESLGGIVEETRGMVHDLAESFDRINANYFGGCMPRPRLTWNRSITAGKFGHYHYATDTVMVSRALDRPHVPSFVVDHVMHHELLHKKHGLRWERGRSHAHTGEFRREERMFEKYHEADQYLHALVARNGKLTAAV
jgi:hypothetical protein